MLLLDTRGRIGRIGSEKCMTVYLPCGMEWNEMERGWFVDVGR